MRAIQQFRSMQTDYSPISECVLNHATMIGYDCVSLEVTLVRGNSKPLLAVYNHLVATHTRNTELNHKTISIDNIASLYCSCLHHNLTSIRMESEKHGKYALKLLRNVNVDHVYEKLKEIRKEKYIVFLIELDELMQLIKQNKREAKAKHSALSSPNIHGCHQTSSQFEIFKKAEGFKV
jgi:hypothetical protein